MNTVEPIRDESIVLDFADYLKNKRKRDYVLFMTGVHTGLRISDILPLKVRDVRNSDYLYYLKEQKTQKTSKVKINEELKEIFKEYIVGMRDYEYLFKKEKGKNRNEPISRQRVWQILNEAANEFEYKERIGCHTLRKTFGYLLYQQTHDAVTLQDIFNHSTMEYTKRYIGVDQDNKDKMYSSLSFKKKRR